MRVQTRLSLFCSIVFGVIFAVISMLIYGLYYKNTEKNIYSNLEKTAYISALFYLEEDELSSKEFDKIRIQFEEIVSESDYQIYDSVNKVSYGDSILNIRIDILDKIRNNGHLSFSTDEYICYGIFYEDNQGDFVVIAKQQKSLIDEQMSLLLGILVTSFFVGLLAIIVFSRWLSHIAYHPFSNVIKQVKNISTNNLDVQIESPQTRDELQDLIDTFNDLLAKISESFAIQKNFVNYVSHEFKTPLASILGNLEVFSIKDRTPVEYKQLSEKLIQQIFQMQEILDTLIVISDLRKDADMMAHTRVDELIWEIINKINNRQPNAKIHMNIDIQAEEEQIMFVANNRTQLLMALFNLIENAVKYSKGKRVDINIFKQDGKLCLSITDKGIGIPPEKLADISKPFFRADNANQIQGSGIGLSIALRILEKNKIKYRIESTVDIGTKIVLIFS